MNEIEIAVKVKVFYKREGSAIILKGWQFKKVPAIKGLPFPTCDNERKDDES